MLDGGWCSAGSAGGGGGGGAVAGGGGGGAGGEGGSGAGAGAGAGAGGRELERPGRVAGGGGRVESGTNIRLIADIAASREEQPAWRRPPRALGVGKEKHMEIPAKDKRFNYIAFRHRCTVGQRVIVRTEDAGY